MRRREFIAGFVGCAAVSLPRAVRAQQADRIHRIGIISGFSEEEMRPLLTAFQNRLLESGWTEGRNMIMDVRLTGGDTARLGVEAASLIATGATVIVAQGTPGVVAVQQHSRTVPVVFTFVGDPVGLGLIESLARPGGQVTGFTNFEYSIGGKWLELLKEIDPRLRRVAVIINAHNPGSLLTFRRLRKPADRCPVGVSTAPVRNASEIENAITAFAQPGSGLIVLPDSLAVSNRHLIIETGRSASPACRIDDQQFHYRRRFDFVRHRLAGGPIGRPQSYVDRILRGAKPAELPVQTPTKFELVINVKSARMLGIAVPHSLLGRGERSDRVRRGPPSTSGAGPVSLSGQIKPNARPHVPSTTRGSSNTRGHRVLKRNSPI